MDKAAFKQALQKCNTMEDFLRVCSETYDFKNARLGPVAKSLLITHIDKVIAVSGAKPKK